ncbi:Hexaprenyldihydroxybenzoate methyltransferase, mitochondrial [Neonectria punicea]|uniref:Ubiquinone biosynthesis O-methyltransferase, mitochondrial n=1 Tax=Neonectria punicea TaxID=979145 RepID=A0ABR1GZ48_9HYPO
MPAPLRPAGAFFRRLGTPSARLLLSPPTLRAFNRFLPGLAATPSPARWNSTASSSSTPTFSSVNPDEVSHFNALAADWWDPHGSSRLLHLMNPLRHDFIRACHRTQVDAPPSHGLTYLDIGCGGGIFAESAARLPSTRSVTAIDPTPSVLTIAKVHARKDPTLRNKLQYRQTSIENLPLPANGGEAYDVVSVFEVIEHIDEPAAFLKRVEPFVKPGGWLVMSTIARTWMSWFTTNFMAEDVLGIVPKGTHDWNKYLNEGELRQFLEGQGWSSPTVQGVIYVPGLGWKEVQGSEKVGNYFFAVRKGQS